MTAQLIDGKALSQQLRADVKARADQLKAKGMIFNDPSPKSFRDALSKAGFYQDWRKKFGEEAMSKLEKYSGKLA